MSAIHFTSTNIINEVETSLNHWLQIDVDPLALAVKWEKEGIFYKHTLGDLLINSKKYMLSHPRYYNIGDEDQQQANRIRDYYQQRMVFRTLKGLPLTSFRKKLYAVINNKNCVREDSLGVLYRLPGLYNEDQFMDDIVNNSVSYDPTKSKNTIREVFQFIGSNRRIVQRQNQLRYWFKDQNQQLATIFVDYNSCATPIIDQYLKKGKHYMIEDEQFSISCLLGRDENFYAMFLSKEYKIAECE